MGHARAPSCLHPSEVEIAVRLAANARYDVVGRRIPYRIGRGPNDSRARFAAAKGYAAPVTVPLGRRVRCNIL
jgi:hypothetical protein